MSRIEHVSRPEVAAFRPASWRALILLCAAQLMTVIDGTVVNVALPTIDRALNFGPGEAQWVVTAYLLCTGGTMLLAGRAADRVGRRRALMLGIVVFTAASLLSGLAQDTPTLVAARAAQGVGAALLSPAALSIITTTYTGHRRTAALSTWGAVSAGGFVAGLLVGGVITTLLGWRWIFFINIPVGVLVLALLPLLVARDARHGDGDAGPGWAMAGAAATLTAGLVAVVYGVGAPHGWGSAATIGSLTGGVVLLGVFAVLDRHTDRPLLAPVLLRTRSLVAGSALMLAATGVLVGTLFVTTFYLEGTLHSSALVTGLDYLPFAIAIGLAAHAASHVLGHLGTRVTATAGLLAVAAGALVLALGTGHGPYYAVMLPAFLLLGAGTGLALTSASVTAMAHVPEGHAGAASGLLMTGHEAGGALGVAVLATVATAAGAHAAAGPPVAAGHHTAFVVTAAVAAGLAALAAVAVPAVRPAPGAVVRPH